MFAAFGKRAGAHTGSERRRLILYAWAVLAELYSRPGLAHRPVTGLPPGELAIAWREGDRRPQVVAFIDALRQVATKV
ncbi:hypothetical protein E1267_36490 [Nonomuraea longispora]|uniref:LysR substrate-binding domain-containing protein n=1 Tax=Nonomuraea longispora TaxID=1848320 RepID=A0A4V2XIR2_9ACTN|nr:hypothetical protein [Nonomuraea longispora]TDB99775.1 hypothetical protein E1267_36490 [Nonomuraea longispora]